MLIAPESPPEKWLRFWAENKNKGGDEPEEKPVLDSFPYAPGGYSDVFLSICHECFTPLLRKAGSHRLMVID